jgi:hypothetical protein
VFNVRNATNSANQFEIRGDANVLMGQNTSGGAVSLFNIRNGASTSLSFIYTDNNSTSFEVDRFCNIKTNFQSINSNATSSLVLGLGTAPSSRNFQQTIASLTAISQGTNDSGFAQSGADTSGNNAVYTNYIGKNWILGGTSQGTGTNKLGIYTGTAPSTNLTDGFQIYSSDIIAGKAAPHFRTEDGDIVKLYTHSAVTTTQGIANALTTLGLLSASTIVSSTDVFVTGATYNNNTFTYTNNTGETFSVNFNTVTGLTSTGTISSNTISATTYQNLPIDVYVTGGTYSSGTLSLTNITGGTFTVTGFSTGSGSFTGGTVTGPTNFTNGLTANTISATTYQNLPVDVFVTGGTYSSGSATFTNNTGGTFTVTGFSTGGGSFTGGTVTGPTNFTAGLTATTISATTYQNYPTQDLATTLGYGNNTGAYDIEMATTRVIKTDNGGGQIDLDFGGNANQVFISTDSGVGAESYLRMVDSSSTHLGTSVDFFATSSSSTNINWSNGFTVNGKFSSNVADSVILTKDNGTLSFTTPSNDMPGVIISSYNSTISSGIRNVAIIAGNGVTATTSGILYTDRLNLWATPTLNNTNTQVLTRNSTTGDIEYRTASSLDTFVTGVTYSANTLTVSQNQGQTPLTATIGLRTKSGSVTAGSFAGTPRTATVTFTTAFANTNYSIQITGSDNRTFTYSSKATTGFTINTNANAALTGNVDWVAIEHGES